MPARSTTEHVVGFIGLGRMGNLMARKIIQRKYKLLIWNRSKSKYEGLQELGAIPKETPRQVVEESDITLCDLSTPTVTESVVLGSSKITGSAVVDGLSKGKLIVDLSTNLPSTIVRMGKAISGKGAALVDSPVVGSIPLASSGTLTILASGKRDDVEKVTPILQSFGKKIWYVGRIGTATSLKLILNLHLYIMMGAFSESLALGIKVGLDPRLMVQIWNETIQKTYVSETKANKILDSDFTPAFTMELALKDLNLASDMAKESGAAMPLGNLVRDLYTASVAMDYKDLDYCAIYRLYEKLLNDKSIKNESSEIL